MTYAITIEKPMTTTKRSNYQTKEGWDWSGLSKKEFFERLRKSKIEAELAYKHGECRPASEFFKEWDEERKLCVTK